MNTIFSFCLCLVLTLGFVHLSRAEPPIAPYGLYLPADAIVQSEIVYQIPSQYYRLPNKASVAGNYRVHPREYENPIPIVATEKFIIPSKYFQTPFLPAVNGNQEVTQESFVVEEKQVVASVSDGKLNDKATVSVNRDYPGSQYTITSAREQNEKTDGAKYVTESQATLPLAANQDGQDQTNANINSELQHATISSSNYGTNDQVTVSENYDSQSQSQSQANANRNYGAEYMADYVANSHTVLNTNSGEQSQEELNTNSDIANSQSTVTQGQNYELKEATVSTTNYGSSSQSVENTDNKDYGSQNGDEIQEQVVENTGENIAVQKKLTFVTDYVSQNEGGTNSNGNSDYGVQNEMTVQQDYSLQSPVVVNTITNFQINEQMSENDNNNYDTQYQAMKIENTYYDDNENTIETDYDTNQKPVSVIKDIDYDSQMQSGNNYGSLKKKTVTSSYVIREPIVMNLNFGGSFNDKSQYQVQGEIFDNVYQEMMGEDRVNVAAHYVIRDKVESTSDYGVEEKVMATQNYGTDGETVSTSSYGTQENSNVDGDGDYDKVNVNSDYNEQDSATLGIREDYASTSQAQNQDQSQGVEDENYGVDDNTSQSENYGVETAAEGSAGIENSRVDDEETTDESYGVRDQPLRIDNQGSNFDGTFIETSTRNNNEETVISDILGDIYRQYMSSEGQGQVVFESSYIYTPGKTVAVTKNYDLIAGDYDVVSTSGVGVIVDQNEGVRPFQRAPAKSQEEYGISPFFNSGPPLFYMV